MKTFTLTSILLLCTVAAFAQWQGGLGMDFTYAQPTRGMKQNISQGGGLTLNFEMFNPEYRVLPTFEMNYIIYGRDKTTQTYDFGDGSFADMDMIVNNEVLTVSGGVKILLRKQGLIMPFATMKAGRAFFTTNLAIFDPDDGDHCEPVDSDLLQRDGTWVYSAGGGLRIDLAALFGKKLQPGNLFLDFSVNSIQGGRVNYMNVDAPANAGQHSMGTRTQDVEADFINTQTQVVHQHHVGYLYNSFVQMVDFRVGLSMRLDKNIMCNPFRF
jgi:hypothetical protein